MTSVSPLASSTTDRAGEYAGGGRQTPWSNEAEQAGLGAMVLDQDAALKGAEILDDTMFYKESQCRVVRSIRFPTQRGDVTEPVTMRDELSRRGERDEQLQSGAGALTGVPSGFVDLDRYTAGFQRSDLIIIAARPSMGKTALALNIVQHAAIEHNTRVAFFSLEMSKDQLVQRLLCSEGLVEAQRLRRGQLRDDDYPKLARAAC